MCADGRIHAARHVEVLFTDHLGVEIRTHSMQALKFEWTSTCDVVHGGNRMCVVCGELWIDQIATRIEQLVCACEVRHIGVRLARVERVTGKPGFLCALDFRIPIRALHQAHVPATAGCA